jgi:hypothetical protein
MLRTVVGLILLTMCVHFAGCSPAKNAKQASDSADRKTDAKSTDVSAPIDPLTDLENERARDFMAKVTSAFEMRDAEALEQLAHPGDEPRDRENTIEYNRSLMDGGDRVKSWTAKRYAKPDWEVLEHRDFSPAPTVWIDVVLNDGSRDYEIFYALAPGTDGEYRSCYYVDKK